MFAIARCLKSSITKIGLARMVVPSAQMSSYNFETLKVVTVADYVTSVSLNRPDKRNAMNKTMWIEIGEAFKQLAVDEDCRSIILSGEGKMFSSGIDVSELMKMSQVILSDDDIARKCRTMKRTINEFQNSFTQVEKCPKPVVAAVWGPCVGAGVDILTATDIRFCSNDAWFQVKEVDMGLAADVGTLHRLPKVIGNQSLVNDLCLTCRQLSSDEALSCGLVSRVLPSKEATLQAATDCATQIACSSPVAVQATKMTLIHGRDHSVDEGLEFVSMLNMSLLQSEDVRLAAMSQMQKSKEKPTFAKL